MVKHMANLDAGQVTQKNKRLISPIIILVLAIIFIIWLLMLFMDKDFYNSFGMDLGKDTWVYIGSAVMIFFIIILIVAGFPARTPQPAPTFTSVPIASAQMGEGVIVGSAQSFQSASGQQVVEAEPVVVEAEIVEVEPILEEEETKVPTTLKKKKAKLVEYPKKVPGGVYGDTIIRVDPWTKLNLRTLLVRSCLICDRQGKCWEEVMDTISRDEFLENIDCKKGLRRLRGGGEEEERPKKLKRKKLKISEEEPVEVTEEGDEDT